MEDKEKRLTRFLSEINSEIIIPQENALDVFYKVKQVESKKKKIARYQLADEKNPAYIIPIGDIHLGNKVCNMEKFKKVLQLVLRTPNCYTILIGDLAETATKESVGNAMFDEDAHLPDQLKILYAAFKPLADKGKILGMLTGNHEMRIEYLTGMNPVQMLAEKLKVPYFGHQGFVYAKVGDIGYRIMCHHGVGSGTTTVGKIRAVEKLSGVAEADIYISGHTHGLSYHYDQIMTFSDEGEMTPRKRHYVAAGSFLDYWNGYAEMKLLQPSTCGSVFIELRNDLKDIRVTI